MFENREKYMIKNKRIVGPGKGRQVLGEYGENIKVPDNWDFLPAGDAGLTRKVSSKGIFWRVQIKKGRRLISQGIWAPKNTIDQAKEECNIQRNSEEYKKKQEYNKKRRQIKQDTYQEEFHLALISYLRFDKKFESLEQKMATLVCQHAIPIGSGTVARTQMIPINERASRAVIAWMRHKTTAYDNIKIANIKGERRAVRRAFAEESVRIINTYRKGNIDLEKCPLLKALQ